MAKFLSALLAIGLTVSTPVYSQSSSTQTGKPTEHLIGTISATDPANHAITIKEDKSGTQTQVSLADTKTLLKVAPGAKDLKSATRITGDQLESGDRVDVRGFKSADHPNEIAARSIVLMSARDLRVAHEEQAAEWQHATAGVVTAVDASAGEIKINERTPHRGKQVAIATSPQTEFLRYSPETPGKPAASQLADLRVGDQVRIVGDSSSDGETVTARKLYSGAFRTLNGTISSIAADGSEIVIKDLASKKPVTIRLNANSKIHKLPPEMAAMLARRANRAAANGSAGGANPDSPIHAPAEPVGAARSGPEMSGAQGGHSGDISQMIERLPIISLADLKPGNAVVVAGAAAAGNENELVATNIIAGVEPILQSAPSRQGGEALGGDWGLGQTEVPQ